MTKNKDRNMGNIPKMADGTPIEAGQVFESAGIPFFVVSKVTKEYICLIFRDYSTGSYPCTGIHKLLKAYKICATYRDTYSALGGKEFKKTE